MPALNINSVCAEDEEHETYKPNPPPLGEGPNKWSELVDIGQKLFLVNRAM